MSCYSTDPLQCAPGVCASQAPCRAKVSDPLRFCQGDEYCDSQARCRPKRAADAPCNSVERCADGLRCAPPPELPANGCLETPGRCAGEVQAAQRCIAAGSRRFNQLCLEDDHCAGELICVYDVAYPDVIEYAGRCRDARSEREACAKSPRTYNEAGTDRVRHSACRDPGTVCSDTAPREQERSPSGRCLAVGRVEEGDACEHDADCREGLLCPGFAQRAICTPAPEVMRLPGEACAHGEQPCQMGYVCDTFTRRCERATLLFCQGDDCPGLGETCYAGWDDIERGLPLRLCSEGVCLPDPAGESRCQPDPCR